MHNTKGGHEMRNSYRTMSLPSGLLTQIEEYVAHNPDGYASVTEFVKVAVREKLTKIRSEKQAA